MNSINFNNELFRQQRQHHLRCKLKIKHDSLEFRYHFKMGLTLAKAIKLQSISRQRLINPQLWDFSRNFKTVKPDSCLNAGLQQEKKKTRREDGYYA